MSVQGAVDAIRSAAAATGLLPNEVWCAAGSGTLMRGLAAAWPSARLFCVQVGRAVTAEEVCGATVVQASLPYSKPSRAAVPFPSDPHYDAKAWEVCARQHGDGVIVFWNVTGPASSV